MAEFNERIPADDHCTNVYLQSAGDQLELLVDVGDQALTVALR